MPRESVRLAQHYNYHRDYDPLIGRYIESDPIGLHAGLNTYGYAFARPIIWSDVYGLDVTVCYYADAAAGFGHVGYSVPGESSTQGFYPKPGKNPFNAPGEIKPDNQEQKQCKVLPANPDQDDCMAKCRKDRKDDPGRYRLRTRQCTEFVRSCLVGCGLSAGPTSGPLPDHFYNQLTGR